LTKFGATVIKNHLIHINDELDKMDDTKTILEVFPIEQIESDNTFMDYYRKNNEE
jgi:hypothetical protein